VAQGPAGKRHGLMAVGLCLSKEMLLVENLAYA
jgi:hypothetical protein